MRLSGITPESFVDGPGLRYVIFTQGCRHCCPNCHNPDSWEMNAGKEVTVKEIIRKFKRKKKTMHAKNTEGFYQGVTFSGGEPFLQAEELAQTAAAAHEIGWDVVTYTGYAYEELTELAANDEGVKSLLCATDILIDGRYIHEKRSVNLMFRGSSNQRIINMAETQKNGKIVLWKKPAKRVLP